MHSCYPIPGVHPTPTQKILTEKDLPDVLKALRDARGKWKEIGLVLGIPITDLNTIEMESDNKVDKCLENMITIWLKRRSLNPSWQSLIEALKEPTVGEEGVADDIEKKYVKAKEVDTTDDASQDSPPCKLLPYSTLIQVYTCIHPLTILSIFPIITNISKPTSY